MAILFTVLIILVAVLLIGVVLIQRSKGGGLASNIGITNQFLGAQKEADQIEKITWYLIGILVVLCLSSGFMYRGSTSSVTGTEEQMEVPTIDPSAVNNNQGVPQLPQAPQE